METRSTAGFGLSSKYPRTVILGERLPGRAKHETRKRAVEQAAKSQKRTVGPCQHLDLNQGLFGLAAAKLAPQRNVLTTALCWLCLDISENMV